MMRIGSSIFSLTPGRFLSRTQRALQQSLMRLSTGRRINLAKDDIAGLMMSERFDAARRGNLQAIRNSNDEMSLLSVAEEALSEMTNILQALRELSVQAASGTLNADERAAIGIEAQALIETFESISSQTEFNGTKLLDGTFGTPSFQVGAGGGSELSLSIPNFGKESVFQKTVGTGAFQKYRSYAWPNALSRVKTADVNGDGFSDIIANCSTDQSTIRVYLGNGDGSFKPLRSVVTGDTLGSNAVGDLNGDGTLDIVALTPQQAVSSFLGIGDGIFEPGTTVTFSGLSLSDLELADMNGDGALDMLVSSSSQGSVSILLGNGDGTFKAKITQSAGLIVGNLVSGDFNQDGHLDVITASSMDNTVYLLTGNGDGTLQNKQSLGTLFAMGDFAVGDLDHDGDLDVIGSCTLTPNLYILKNDGSGSFTTATYTTGGPHISPQLGDINGDGSIDVVTTLIGGGLDVLLGNGDGTFKAHESFATTGTNGYASLSDLNGDAVLDIAVSDSAGIDVFSANTVAVTAASDLDFHSQSRAQATIGIIDRAFSKINKERSALGALQNRLEVTIHNLYGSSENLSRAYDEIVLADVAGETAELVRSQILQQAGIAMMSQANLISSRVLVLLEYLG